MRRAAFALTPGSRRATLHNRCSVAFSSPRGPTRTGFWHRLSAILATLVLNIPAFSAGHNKETFKRCAEPTVERGLKFLAATQQADGGWPFQDRSDPAITALVVQGFIQHPAFGSDHPVVRRAIDVILASRQPDGGLYDPTQGIKNYQTSVCLMALAATKDPKLGEVIKRAQESLKADQWDEGENYDRSHVWYGGAGYGEHKRPDLSNTQMMLEALHQSGLPSDDPVYQKALVFIARSQMLGESNDQPFARGVSDGGFIYTPANEGESKAGTVSEGGKTRLRTYGSMTYAGFKSLLYAGLSHDDPRVKAAFDWVRTHYTLDENPNMPGQQTHEGLYYFYHVFARALRAWGEDVVTDPNGYEHDWRNELCRKLADLQNSDGSWVNQADRWREGNPYLVTAYAVLALQAAME